MRDAHTAFGTELPFELAPTNLVGVFTSPAAARGRDLTSSGDRLAARVWPAKHQIAPYLESHPGMTHQLRGARQRDDGSYTSDNWSGVTLAPAPGQRWTGAVAHWAIPAVGRPAGPPGADGGWNSSSWVGLDGGYGSTNQLAAGVEQRLDAAGDASYIAWCEWFVPPRSHSPGYVWQTDIPNFQLRAGDVVHCSARYLARVAGQLTFANDTTGEHLSITLVPPPGATFAGACAAWIMETPDFGQGPGTLPAFTPVCFQGAACSGQGIPAGDPVDGDVWIIQSFGITLTEVKLASECVCISPPRPQPPSG